MKYRSIALIAVIFSIIYLALPTHADAGAGCRGCHQGNPVNAVDTISPDGKTCFVCHNPKYTPDWQGLNVHDIHAYNILVLPPEDYIKRHPDTGLECTSCHAREYVCTDCHQTQISHFEEAADCSACHNTMTGLFRHRTVNLTKHNIFGIEAPGSCEICHKKGGGLLQLSSGKTVDISQSRELCRQCHSTTYKAWINKDHWSVPAEINTDEDSCSYCHDVHAPELLYWMPPPGRQAFPFVKVGLMAFFTLFIILTAFFIRKHRKS